MSKEANIGAFRIIVFTPNEASAAKHPVPITTPKRCGYVSLIPNLTPETVKRIIFGPGLNRPINTKINKGKNSKIISPHNNFQNSKYNNEIAR